MKHKTKDEFVLAKDDFMKNSADTARNQKDSRFEETWKRIKDGELKRIRGVYSDLGRKWSENKGLYVKDKYDALLRNDLHNAGWRQDEKDLPT